MIATNTSNKMNSLIRYSNNSTKTRDRNEADEIETLANNLTAYFLTTYKAPSSPRTAKNNKPKKQNMRGKLSKALSTSDIYSRKSSRKLNKENSVRNIDTSRYEQQYNKFKQTCINIEKTKNTLYKENIRNLLDEKDVFMEENEKLLSMLKEAKKSIKEYQNKNKMYEKRLQFYDKMLSVERMKNSYNDVNFEMNCFLREEYEEDVKFEKRGRIGSNDSLDFVIDCAEHGKKGNSMNNSSITFDNQFDDRNKERDELLDRLQMEMEVLKYKLLKKEKDEAVMNNVSNDDEVITNNNYHGRKSDFFISSFGSEDNSTNDDLKEPVDLPKCINDEQNEQVRQQMDVVNDIKERLEIEILVCDIFHILSTDFYCASSNKHSINEDEQEESKLSVPSIKTMEMLQTIDENSIYFEESRHIADDDNEQLEIDIAVTDILSATLVKVQTSNENNIIQLRKQEVSKQLYKNKMKENLEIEKMNADILFNLSHAYYKDRDQQKCNQIIKSNSQSSMKLNLQSKNDLQMEIMEINLLIADIIVTLSSCKIDSAAKVAPLKKVDNQQKQNPKKLCDGSNAPIINKNVIIDSEETIQEELMEIDMIVSEIYLMITLDIQEDTNPELIEIPPLSYPIILDYPTCDSKESKVTMKKERFNVVAIVADLSFSLASKSCEMSYCHYNQTGSKKIDISTEVLASEQLLSYSLHNKEHRMNEIYYHNTLSSSDNQDLSDENLCINILASDISYTLYSGSNSIDSYYVHKNKETMSQESFYDDKHHYDASFDKDYPQEQIFVVNDNTGVLNSFMKWFRKA